MLASSTPLVCSRPMPGPFATERHGDALHHIYAVTAWQGGDPANICDEHTELRWFSIGEMRGLANIVDADYPFLAELGIAGGVRA